MPPFPEEALHRCVEELLREGRLTAEQARAVEAAAGNLTLISGGPGTGKTHTAAQLVQALASHLQRGGDDPLRVAVAAPTGKAAAHLSKSIERRGLTVGVALHSATLHSLLIAAEGDEASSLPYDVVLVDECSMVDVALMERLLGRTPFACRLVMMGDHNQLPSVEPGAPFQELIAFMQTAEARRRPVLLTRSLRTDSGQILACADAIKGGEAPLAARLCGEGDAVAWPRRALPDDPRPLIGEVADRFPAPHLDNYRALLHAFRLLTPHRQGSWGSEALNRHILKRLVARHGARPFAAPFIITANDHQLRLYNGEMGVLMMHNPLHGIGEGDYALFDGDGGQRRLDAALLPPHELAYCLTVHKSQGSEYDEVLIVMPPGSELFGREALYTAVTRAKRRVTLWCSPDTFCKTVEASHRRVGFLEERLRRLVDGADSKSYS